LPGRLESHRVAPLQQAAILPVDDQSVALDLDGIRSVSDPDALDRDRALDQLRCPTAFDVDLELDPVGLALGDVRTIQVRVAPMGLVMLVVVVPEQPMRSANPTARFSDVRDLMVYLIIGFGTAFDGFPIKS
jgi:hypothetical protein